MLMRNSAAVGIPLRYSKGWKMEGSLPLTRTEDTVLKKPDDPRLILVNHNFRFLRNFLRLYKLVRLTGILADLGVLRTRLIFLKEVFQPVAQGELDMRMDRRKSLTARTIINTSSEENLLEMFRRYGRLKIARNSCRGLFQPVKIRRLLLRPAWSLFQSRAERVKRTSTWHRSFRHSRIVVNQELEST